VKYRIYYWIVGTPEHRPGGPWHVQDFLFAEGSPTWLTQRGSNNRKDFYDALSPLCCAVYFLEGEHMPKHDYLSVYPPVDAVCVEKRTEQPV